MINQLLQDLPSLDPSRIEDILVGNAVPEAEQGLQMARWISIRPIFQRIVSVQPLTDIVSG